MSLYDCLVSIHDYAVQCYTMSGGTELPPDWAGARNLLARVGGRMRARGGSAWLMNVKPRSPEENSLYVQLFDRSDEYAEARASWKEAQRSLHSLAPQELVRLQRKLRREYDAIRAIDFFAGEASVEAETAWLDFGQRIERILSPDEPSDTRGAIPRLDARDYTGRLWATRRRPWVDRVASAWLIGRFIDRTARFAWLAKPSDCPTDAIGFDFDGATFSHVGDRVTFETLLASFNLEGDAALMRLAAVVHVLDVGGDPMPEAAGFEAVLSGARERLADDDALLAEMSTVLDSLYAHFARGSDKKSPR